MFDEELPDADVVISQPFWPAYMTAERIAKAKNLKLIVTAGIGSDHVDLAGGDRAQDHGRRSHLLQFDQRRRTCGDDDPRASCAITFLRTIGCVKGGWNIADCVDALLRSRRHACRHGRGRAASALAVLRRLKPFDVHLHYTDRHRLPETSRRSWISTCHPNRRGSCSRSATW